MGGGGGGRGNGHEGKRTLKPTFKGKLIQSKPEISQGREGGFKLWRYR